MSDSSLVISFAPISPSSSSSWLRVTQVGKATDIATIADAVKTIEVIFNLDACDGNPGSGGESVDYDINGNPIAPISEEEFVEIVDKTLDIAACLPAEYSWEAQVEIVCSDPTIPYALQIEGGEETGRVIFDGNKTVSIILKNQTQAELPYPVLGPVTGNWGAHSGESSPSWRISGSNILFGSPVTGQLNLTYKTRYETVTVAIPQAGALEELQTAEVLCFWNRLAEQLTLEPPEILDDEAADAKMCNPTVHGDVEDDDDESQPCWKNVYHVVRCQCSGDEVTTYTVEETVDCPEGVIGGLHMISTDAVVVEYIDCGEDSSGFIAGATYKVNDPAYYEQVCCFPPDHPLPPCPTIYRTWKPGASIKPSAEYWKSMNDGNVELIAVTPDGGVCGELKQTWEVSGNCCDVAPPIDYEWENSSDVIADNSSGVVFWNGGLGPYTVTVEGTGFWANSAKTSKTIDVTTDYAFIYTSDACGSCDVTIMDACGQMVAGALRSTDGRWVQILSSYSRNPISGAGCGYGGNTTWCSNEGVKGKYKTLAWSLQHCIVTSGTEAPVRFNCPNQYVRSICAEQGYPISRFGLPAPSVGHYPGDCEITSDCRQSVIDDDMTYCQSNNVYYPGATWDVWEWRC